MNGRVGKCEVEWFCATCKAPTMWQFSLPVFCLPLYNKCCTFLKYTYTSADNSKCKKKTNDITTKQQKPKKKVRNILGRIKLLFWCHSI